MMQRVCMMALVFALFAACVVLPSPMHMQAYAQPAPGGGNGADGTATGNNAPIAATGEPQTQVVGETGGPMKCEDLPEAQGGALLGKLVPCLTYTIEQSTIEFTRQFVNWLSPLLYSFLLLVVTLFGVRVAANEPEIYKQGFLLLLKIAIVATILSDLGGTRAYNGAGSESKLIPAVYNIMNDTQEIVSNTIQFTDLKCNVAQYQGAQTSPVWAIMDCVMGKLYGFTVGTDGKPSMLLMTSLAGLLTGFLFGGAWGVVVFFGMIGVLFTMFMLVIRTVVGFLIGYMVVCLMLIVSALFLPLAFLRGTSQYFDSYWRTILGAFLTPIIITAYSMFALVVYDKMLFADDSIVAKLFEFENIKDAIEPTKKLCDRHVTSEAFDVRMDMAGTAVNPADRDKMMSFPNMQNFGVQTLTGGNDACNFMKVAPVALSKIKGANEDQKKDLTAMFMHLMNLFILAYLISQGQQMLPDIVTQLVGRSSTMRGTKAVLENDGKYEAAYKNAMSTAISKFRKTDDPEGGYKSGSAYVRDFARDSTNAINDGGQAYFNTLKNNPGKKK